MNVDHDTEMVGVQIILLDEDSVRFYSSALPALFKIVLEESQELSQSLKKTVSMNFPILHVSEKGHWEEKDVD